MRRLLIAVAVTALFASAGRAETIPMSASCDGLLTVSATRSLGVKTVDTTVLDEVVVTLTGYSSGSGYDDGDLATLLSGDFTFSSSTGGVAGVYLMGDESTWTTYALGPMGSLLGTSYVNFDLTTGKLPDGGDAYRTATALSEVYGSFGNNWFTTTSSKMWDPDVSVMMKLYVTQGTTSIVFSGNSAVYVPGGGDTSAATSFTLSEVPEPSSLMLLIFGLTGMSIYALRKRK